MKALVGAFNQEKALVGAFSVIVQLHRLIVYTASILYPLSSGQISRCHTSVITGDRTHQPRCCSSSITDARAGSYRYQWTNQLQMTPLMNFYQPKILPRANYNHIMHDSAMIPSNRFWCIICDVLMHDARRIIVWKQIISNWGLWPRGLNVRILWGWGSGSQSLK